MKRNIYTHERAERRERIKAMIVLSIGAILAALAGWFFPALPY